MEKGKRGKGEKKIPRGPRFAIYCTCGKFVEVFGTMLYPEPQVCAMFALHRKEGCVDTNKQHMKKLMLDRMKSAAFRGDYGCGGR